MTSVSYEEVAGAGVKLTVILETKQPTSLIIKLTLEQVTVFNVKEDAGNDEPTEDIPPASAVLFSYKEL